MRDADDDEETRVFSASADAVLPASAALPARAEELPARAEELPARAEELPARAEGLPPPRIPNDDVMGEPVATRAAPAPAETPGDDEDATRLMAATPAAKQQKWLVSDGPNAPVDLTHHELRAALSSGKVSRAALAWQKGMREWQKVADIPTLNAALAPRSSPRSSPPPKRSSRPRAAPTAPRHSKPAPRADAVSERPLSPLAAALSADSLSAPDTAAPDTAAPDLAARDVAEADTPPSGSKLLSTSVPTADFSEITPAHTPQSQRAQQAGERPALSKPERIEIEPVPALTQRFGSAVSRPKTSIHTPRPAAGRPPAPGEPVAKTPEAPDTKVAPVDAKVVINEPPAAILATGLAQARLNPTIETQRETTQPARWRPTLQQLRAAGQPPNVVLWVLGAGGWVLSGVLAGILIAKNNAEPSRDSTTAATVTTQASLTREHSDPPSAARVPSALAAAPVATATAEAPAALHQAAPVNSPLPPRAASPGLPPRPAKPAPAKPPPLAAVKPAVADPSGLSGPTSTNDINTPGF